MVGKEVDLSSAWARIEIHKSDAQFASIVFITFDYDEYKFIEKDFTHAQSIVLHLANVQNNTTLETSIWTLKITSVSASQLGRSGLTKGAEPKTLITVSAVAEDAEKSKNIVGGFYENKTGKQILDEVLSSLGTLVKYKGNPSTKTIKQVFIPNTYLINAFGYLSTVVGIYDTPVFYTHDFDGVYIYDLKSLHDKQKKFEVIYNVTDQNSSALAGSGGDYKLITSRVIVTPNRMESQFTLTSKLVTTYYTPDKLYTRVIGDYSSVSSPSNIKLGTFTNESKRLMGAMDLTTVSEEASKTQFLYRLLSANTIITVIDEWSKFLDLRPGSIVTFNSGLDKQKALNGEYVLRSMRIQLEKQQQIISDMDLTLCKYGLNA